jgi:orotate phosphoribosyltransferase
MTDWKRALLDVYARSGAAKTGSFKLASGAMSDFYIDGRVVTTRPDGLRAIVAGMRAVIEQHQLLRGGVNLVGPVLSGVPIAAALSLELNVPYVIDRGAAKQHGMGKRFEGVFGDNPNALVVDDLLTSGGTLLKSVEGLREAGKTVTHAVIVVDRQEGGPEQLAKAGVTAYTLISRADLKAHLAAAPVR